MLPSNTQTCGKKKAAFRLPPALVIAQQWNDHERGSPSTRLIRLAECYNTATAYILINSLASHETITTYNKYRSVPVILRSRSIATCVLGEQLHHESTPSTLGGPSSFYSSYEYSARAH